MPMRHSRFLSLLLVGCSPEPTAPTTTLAVPQGPLPDPIELHRVELALEIDPRTEGFSGKADLHIHLGADRNGLWMHGQGLNVSEVTLLPSQGEPIDATWTAKSATGTVYVQPEQFLKAGDYTIHVEWSAPFADDLSGMFKVEERGNAFVLAKSESIQARRAVPGFDEPRYKAPYQVQITVPDGYTVIGNGREVSRTPAHSGFETVSLAETAPLPTYLLSFAVGPFESISGPTIPPSQHRTESIPLRGFARPGRASDLGVTLALTPPLIRILEDEFGLPFPDKKLDIVAAPAWPSGATELAGAITYREARVLLGERDDETVDPAARDRMLVTHAHELVHMWFGNMVTPAWWNDLWLKEGFATWGSALSLSTLEPDAGHDLRAIGRKIGALQTDSLATARAVREPILGDADIRNAYDSITYGKGMAIIHMVDHGYGSEVFRPAVRSWLEANADQSTDTEAFIRALSDASGTPALGATFSTFLDQAGVPLVQVALDCPNNHPPSVTLRQQRYRPKGSRIRDTQRWTIPVCLEFDGDRPPLCTVIDSKDHAVTLPEGPCPRLVRPNPGGHGYYRFAMSTARWNTLATALPSLPAAEAMMIVDSATAGFAAQSVPAAAVRRIYEGAARHPSRHVVAAPLSAISSWNNALNTEARDALNTWSKKNWEQARQRVAMTRTKDARLLAAALLTFDAITLEDVDARSRLVQQLDRRLSGETKALSSSSYDAALRVIAEDRGAGPLAELTARILELDDPQLERAALTAPGHLKDPQQRIAAFDAVLTEGLDPRIAFARVLALMSSPNASRRSDIRTRIEQDWGQLSEVIPGQWRRKLPQLWAGAACSRDTIDGLKAWFDGDAADAAPGHERVLAQTVERMELCAASDWMSSAIPSAFE